MKYVGGALRIGRLVLGLDTSSGGLAARLQMHGPYMCLYVCFLVKRPSGSGEGYFGLFSTKHAGSFVYGVAGSVGEVAGP